MNIDWDAERYSANFGFVYEYGEDLLSLFSLPKGAVIADVGCGAGQLTRKLSAMGYRAFGLDASEEMVALARKGGGDFRVADASMFALDEPVDGIFSNAVFHWIDDQPALVNNLARNLKPGGELVCEFGGHGCGGAVHSALAATFKEEGLKYAMPFYFPTIGQWIPLLEAAGLRPVYCRLFPRPTAQRGEHGVAEWIRMFVKAPFAGMDEGLKERIISRAEERLRPILFKDGGWFVDYVRIRIKAVRV